MPVSWDQLMTLKSGAQWTIATGPPIPQLSAVRPVGGLLEGKQALTTAMKRLGFTAPSAS
jgi:bifunctional non-homologous end joining protein LigD